MTNMLTVLVGAGLELALQLDDAGVRRHFGIVALERRGNRLALRAEAADLKRLRAACENEARDHPEPAYRRSNAAAVKAITKALGDAPKTERGMACETCGYTWRLDQDPFKRVLCPKCNSADIMFTVTTRRR